MSDALSVARGFFGKLPSRGDFLRAGLPRSFTDRWDDWLQCCLADGRARLGRDWTPCWLEAPVWHFILAPGICGPDAVLGLFVPSVDKAGRDFPLTVAATATSIAALTPDGVAWLDRAEAAACDAVTEAREPDVLLGALAAPSAKVSANADLPDPGSGAVWWTAGAPRVLQARLTTAAMPAPAAFAAMLRSDEEAA